MGRPPALFAHSTRRGNDMRPHRASRQQGSVCRPPARLIGSAIALVTALTVLAGACTPAGSAPPPAVQDAARYREPLPLTGEFAVTANQDDHSLSIIPIGLASVVATVPLDIAPRGVATAPNSDTALAADAAPSSRALAVASLNATKELASLDAGDHPDLLAAPPVDTSGPVLMVTDADNTIRAFDPA